MKHIWRILDVVAQIAEHLLPKKIQFQSWMDVKRLDGGWLSMMYFSRPTWLGRLLEVPHKRLTTPWTFTTRQCVLEGE